ncbi:hypothetical protein ACHAQH_006521 [Verticillium albo-atrum]
MLTDERWSLADDQMDLGLVNPEDYIYSDTIFNPETSSPAMFEPLLASPPTVPKSVFPNFFPQPADLMRSPQNSQQLISLACRPPAQKRTLGQCLSPSCRRFITATLRTFPRLMAQPTKWPPFIHPVASGLHFNERDANPRPATLQPLRPLAACRVIAQGFVARTEESMDFLWRSIEAEERWMKSQVSMRLREAETCIADG